MCIKIPDKQSNILGYLSGILYFIAYLYSIGNITIEKSNFLLSLDFLENIQDKIFKTIAPFVWEPIGILYIVKSAAIFISVPNIILGLALAVLVYLNISTSIYLYKLPRICNIKVENKSQIKSTLGIIPSLFTGFACCAPTFLIAIGASISSLTVFIIEVRQFLIPISFALMIIGFYANYKRIKKFKKQLNKSF